MTMVSGPFEGSTSITAKASPWLGSFCQSATQPRACWSYNVCNQHNLFFVKRKEVLWKVRGAFAFPLVTHH